MLKNFKFPADKNNRINQSTEGTAMEIMGLASGNDWSKTIKELMYLERAPIRQWETRQSEFTKDKDAWKDINSRLLSLKGKSEDLLSATTWGKMSATSDDATVVTATASISAEPAIHDIKVKQLAQAHQVAGSQVGDPAAAIGLGDGTGAYTFTLNGVAINVADNYSLNTVKDAINAATFGAGDDLTASIIDNRLTIKAADTGAASTIILVDSADNPGATSPTEVLEQIGILTDAKAIATELYAAQDAIFNVDGLEVTRGKNSGLTDVVQGLTLELKDVTGDPLLDVWPTDYLAVKLTVAADTSSIKTMVEDWVAQYNSSVDFIRETTKYDATTKTAGELSGNYTAISIEQRLASMALGRYSGLTGQYTSLAEIGITLGTYGTDDADKLVIDSSALDAALAANPQWVEDLFGKDTNGDSVKDYGVAAGFKSYLQPLVEYNGIIDNQENSLQDSIDSLTDRIESYENILELREKSLRTTFTNLESALAKFQNTSSWLTNQISQMSQ